MRTTMPRAVLLLLVVSGCERGSGLPPTHRGIYLGGQANVFTSCGESKLHWVQASARSQKILNVGGHLLGGPAGMRPIYVELRGHVLPGRTQAEYDGTLQVDTVLKVSGRRPASCGLPKGSRPFGGVEQP